uniref:Uncharacterized protein n=1 Tax=Rhizophora mucronata TaxID=61149 RepID=A0A2P2N7B5_RHIMU
MTAKRYHLYLGTDILFYFNHVLGLLHAAFSIMELKLTHYFIFHLHCKIEEKSYLCLGISGIEIFWYHLVDIFFSPR